MGRLIPLIEFAIVDHRTQVGFPPTHLRMGFATYHDLSNELREAGLKEKHGYAAQEFRGIPIYVCEKLEGTLETITTEETEAGRVVQQMNYLIRHKMG